ncbi:MAG: hypothetical protein U0136_16725 [Bdellovibrionota bacterium]
MADASIKKQIISALEHPEAEDGLYFGNLTQLYEEEERPPVVGKDEDILEALKELISEGRVSTSEGEAGVIFILNR